MDSRPPLPSIQTAYKVAMEDDPAKPLMSGDDTSVAVLANVPGDQAREHGGRGSGGRRLFPRLRV
ncbi:hypothetical protein BDM02DRAFT_3113010 [Thelephora ganbajun]|uniref:Uncharacterized protein n=1 Tax=Thelephora ganbajun TaxID=370292 RepID=A0ACB6ZK27_THEGA|nr:hypothetical protein BDM02DRAFT_3113010 [Thelephora ganbajun]